MLHIVCPPIVYCRSWHCGQDILTPHDYTVAKGKEEQMRPDILIIGVLFPAIPLMMANFGNR